MKDYHDTKLNAITKRWTPGDPIPKGQTARAWRALQANAEEFERELERRRFTERRPADRRAA